MEELFGIDDASLRKSIRKRCARRTAFRPRTLLQCLVTALACGLSAALADLIGTGPTLRFTMILLASFISTGLFIPANRRAYEAELRRTLATMNRCTTCGYDLAEPANNVCPECGSPHTAPLPA